jgi:photosystem II stability/assembly factor-like uncharacterized protein
MKILYLLLLLAGVVGGARGTDTTGVRVSRLHAAVFLVRGGVVGANVGAYGPFVRESDTTWHRLSRSNMYTFGFGSWARDGLRRLYVAAGNGLHRSTDDGKTWKIVTGWNTMEILSVLPDREDVKRILVATPWGVYRTMDDGTTWKPCMSGFRKWYVRSLFYDSRKKNIIYALAEDDAYSTTDGGTTWRPMHAGTGSLLSFMQRPGHPDTFLAGFEDQGLRISTDGAKTWSAARCPSEASVYGMGASSDGAIMYAGGWKTGVWQSVDGGEHWNEIWRTDAIEALFCFLVDPADQQHVYAGTDGNGVYESADGGIHWSYAGLVRGKIKHLFFYP